ncbi:MAG: M24 family metallopeptidase [Candidatus Thermoplasmatota archaeon]|nr:M24 family metallopeptidase [Candidatus Thermoplasmatota archaeon]
MHWSNEALCGPDGEDWRVPPSELASRQSRFATALAENQIDSAWVQDPVDMYWLVGNRQSGGVHVHSDGSVTQYVRNSLERASFESGENNSPHEVVKHPRMAELSETLGSVPALQLGRLPASDANFMQSKLGIGGDCTQILWNLREIKSDWELERMKESGEIQRRMFDAIHQMGCEGVSEIELAAAADEVSRAAGFAGHIRMRKWPMDCERVVIASGSSAAVPTFFDSALGATGPHPLAALGAGFKRIEVGEPVIVDIVHVHRGYVSDMTRMFSVGPLDEIWNQRLADMDEISIAVRESLGRGDDCSTAWRLGYNMAKEMGHAEHLMGQGSDQARFLGHSIGLELDETPVVAEGFDRPLPIGGTMAIEPKVVFSNGAIGVEDCWARTSEGMQCLSSGTDFPLWSEL